MKQEMDLYMPFMNSASRSAVMLMGVLSLCSCTTVGPQSIAAGRGLYTEVINRTEDEQVLNALVRLRYDETFGMISVASVTANLRFRTVVRAEAGIGDSNNYLGNLVPLTAGVGYEENPTISYVPLDGEDFMRQMLSPISVSEWLLMSGPVKRKGALFALAVRRLNGLRNPLPHEEPASPEFARVVEVYGELRGANVLDIVQSPDGGQNANYFWEIHDYVDAYTDGVMELLELLGIEAELDGSVILLPITESVGRSTSAIHVQTRSLYDVLRIFGAGIEIPSEHLEAGIVERLPLAESEGGHLLTVRSSEEPPAAATVQIRFHDRWFYIDAADTQSKRAFMFLRTFIGVRLAASGTAQRAPVLTVPVN